MSRVLNHNQSVRIHSLNTSLHEVSALPLSMEQAIVGGGCFWCVEGAYKQIKGVASALLDMLEGLGPIRRMRKSAVGQPVMLKLSLLILTLL